MRNANNSPFITGLASACYSENKSFKNFVNKNMYRVWIIQINFLSPFIIGTPFFALTKMCLFLEGEDFGKINTHKNFLCKLHYAGIFRFFLAIVAPHFRELIREGQFFFVVPANNKSCWSASWGLNAKVLFDIHFSSIPYMRNPQLPKISTFS